MSERQPVCFLYSVCGTHMRVLRHLSRIVRVCMLHVQTYAIHFVTVDDEVDRKITLSVSDVREFSPDRLSIVRSTHVCTHSAGVYAATVLTALEIGRLLASGTLKEGDRVVVFSDDDALRRELAPMDVVVISPAKMDAHDEYWKHRELMHLSHRGHIEATAIADEMAEPPPASMTPRASAANPAARVSEDETVITPVAETAPPMGEATDATADVVFDTPDHAQEPTTPRAPEPTVPHAPEPSPRQSHVIAPVVDGPSDVSTGTAGAGSDAHAADVAADPEAPPHTVPPDGDPAEEPSTQQEDDGSEDAPSDGDSAVPPMSQAHASTAALTDMSQEGDPDSDDEDAYLKRRIMASRKKQGE